MKRIVLLHTVQVMYLQFEKRVREALREEVKIDNILDTFLASNTNEIGYFSTDNMNRLYHTLKSAELTRPDCIPVVCSSLSPFVEQLQPLISAPLLTIDKRLGSEAIAKGDNLMVLASATSPIAPTVSLIEKAAQQAGRKVNIDSIHDMRAFNAMMSADMATHEKVMLETAEKIKGYNAVVFAQGSLEYLTEKVTKITGCPVVSAPQLLLEDIKAVVESN